jgi:hypothetical protein
VVDAGVLAPGLLVDPRVGEVGRAVGVEDVGGKDSGT